MNPKAEEKFRKSRPKVWVFQIGGIDGFCFVAIARSAFALSVASRDGLMVKVNKGHFVAGCC